MLNKLRAEQTSLLPNNEIPFSLSEGNKDGGNNTGPQAYTTEILFLKVSIKFEDDFVSQYFYLHMGFCRGGIPNWKCTMNY